MNNLISKAESHLLYNRAAIEYELDAGAADNLKIISIALDLLR